VALIGLQEDPTSGHGGRDSSQDVDVSQDSGINLGSRRKSLSSLRSGRAPKRLSRLNNRLKIQTRDRHWEFWRLLGETSNSTFTRAEIRGSKVNSPFARVSFYSPTRVAELSSHWTFPLLQESVLSLGKLSSTGSVGAGGAWFFSHLQRGCKSGKVALTFWLPLCQHFFLVVVVVVVAVVVVVVAVVACVTRTSF